MRGDITIAGLSNAEGEARLIEAYEGKEAVRVTFNLGSDDRFVVVKLFEKPELVSGDVPVRTVKFWKGSYSETTKRWNTKSVVKDLDALRRYESLARAAIQEVVEIYLKSINWSKATIPPRRKSSAPVISLLPSKRGPTVP